MSINDLYIRVIYWNSTLTNLLETSRTTPSKLVMCQKNLVQEAVDTLLDNGISGQPIKRFIPMPILLNKKA